MSGRLTPPCWPRLDRGWWRCQNDCVSQSALAFAASPVKTGSWSRSAVCGALVFAQVFAFAHVALVAHRVCAEHGESVHSSPPGETLAMAEPDEALARVSDAGTAAVGHDHEHCSCMAHSRERFVLPPCVAEAVSRLAEFPGWSPSSRPSPALAVELLLFAPKSSPPISL